MNAAKRAKVIESFLETYSGPVMKDKGGAYSRGEENSNSNFYRVGEALGRTPMETAWVYALKHIDAISAYIKGGCDGEVIGGESVEGRIGDAVNYLLILYSILVQEGVLKDPTSGKFDKNTVNVLPCLSSECRSAHDYSFCGYDCHCPGMDKVRVQTPEARLASEPRGGPGA